MAGADQDRDVFATVPLVDSAMIEGLREALGAGTDMLVERAAAVVEDRVAQLSALADRPLEDRVARLAHEIGGVAGQVGMARLSRAALALEQISRAGDATEAAQALDGVRAIEIETRTAMRA